MLGDKGEITEISKHGKEITIRMIVYPGLKVTWLTIILYEETQWHRNKMFFSI